MYRVVIVDDELIVRNGLRQHFDWAKYEIEIVGEAENGEEALALIHGQKIDIVVTDVRMPYMDGIELARRLRQMDADIKIIFVSGYDDVDYLKSALRFEAIDYILKSIDLDEFEQTIRRVVEKIKKEEEQAKLQTKMEMRLAQSIPLLQEKLLMTLIRDEGFNLRIIKDRIGFLDLPIQWDQKFYVLVARIENLYSIYDEMSEHDKQLMSFAVLNVAEEILKKTFNGLVFESEQGEFTFLLPFLEGDYESGILDFLRELEKALHHSLSLSFVFGISRHMSDITGLKECYESARRAIRCGFSLGSNRMLHVDKGTKSNSFSRRAWEDTLSEALSSGNWEKVSHQLDEMFHTMEAEADEAQLLNEMFCLLLLPERVAADYHINAAAGETTALCQRFFCCNDFEQRYALMRTVYREVTQGIHKKRESRSDLIVEHIRKLLQENFTQPITIAEIAQKVYLTPTYICLLFKQETGVTINDYLTTLRVDHAKKLLCDPRMKLYDICYAVGYASPTYFSRWFKKQTGFAPGEYRDKIPE